MGLVQDFIGMLFGSDRNVLVETAEVFRENADKAGERQSATQAAALAQFAAEFRDQRSWFDRLIDGINRLPRPMMAFGALGLIVSAMYSPDWFAARMSGLAQVPEPLWWLMGAIKGKSSNDKLRKRWCRRRWRVLQASEALLLVMAMQHLMNGAPRMEYDRIERLEKRVVALETQGAIDDVHRDNVGKRLSSIEDTLKWLVRLVLGGLLMAGIAFVVQGGIAP